MKIGYSFIINIKAAIQNKLAQFTIIIYHNYIYIKILLSPVVSDWRVLKLTLKWEQTSIQGHTAIVNNLDLNEIQLNGYYSFQSSGFNLNPPRKRKNSLVKTEIFAKKDRIIVFRMTVLALNLTLFTTWKQNRFQRGSAQIWVWLWTLKVDQILYLTKQ